MRSFILTFLPEVLENIEKKWFSFRSRKGSRIYDQLRFLGSSVDWERTCFTMDPVSSQIRLFVPFGFGTEVEDEETLQLFVCKNDSKSHLSY